VQWIGVPDEPPLDVGEGSGQSHPYVRPVTQCWRGSEKGLAKWSAIKERRDGLSIKHRDGRKGEHQFPYIPMSFQAV
jgi:hypothetical protein